MFELVYGVQRAYRYATTRPRMKDVIQKTEKNCIFWNSFRKRLHLFWSLLSMLLNFRFSPLGTPLRSSLCPINPWIKERKLLTLNSDPFQIERESVSINVKCINFDSVSKVWTEFQRTCPHIHIISTQTIIIKMEKVFLYQFHLNAMQFGSNLNASKILIWIFRSECSQVNEYWTWIRWHVPFGIRFKCTRHFSISEIWPFVY